jgi:MOSC domain-containing protein YiiM
MVARAVGLHVNPEGGVPKHPRDHLVINQSGCVGDKQLDTRHHGGPQRAVCLLLTSVLEHLQAEGHPIRPGTTGENLLVDGLEPDALSVGARITVGEVVLEVTGDAPPCKTIKTSFEGGSFRELSHRQRQGHTRWYARVLVEGTVYLHDPVSLQ